MEKQRNILLADMESFYASVEVSKDPSLKDKPVVVCGDPQRRHGIVLAATKEAKAFGISTGMPAYECTRLCPQVIFVKPHMNDYLDASLKITEIFKTFSDKVMPYSIDEQFLDITECEKLWGPPEETAKKIMQQIYNELDLKCRIGIGSNPLQAKMACDCFAKKNPSGMFKLSFENYTEHIWPLPVRKLFGVGERMEKNLFNIGIRTVGQLASLSREDLKLRWGVNGEILWLNAHGIDYSKVDAGVHNEQKGVGHHFTLPRDYIKEEEIRIVLLEITEEVCRRARALNRVGEVVNVHCRGADFNHPHGFSRQVKMPEPTASTMDVYHYALKLFLKHWDKKPVRGLGVTLSGLMNKEEYQISLLEDKEKKIALYRAMDNIRTRFGTNSIFRLSSLCRGSQLFNRAGKIGGHDA